MYLEFYGAADDVTGSLHRIHLNGKDVLLDCGMLQGHWAEANRLNREVPRWATEAHCLVLSHAHLDHSGSIPSLVKHHFAENVYCAPRVAKQNAEYLSDFDRVVEETRWLQCTDKPQALTSGKKGKKR